MLVEQLSLCNWVPRPDRESHAFCTEKWEISNLCERKETRSSALEEEWIHRGFDEQTVQFTWDPVVKVLWWFSLSAFRLDFHHWESLQFQTTPGPHPYWSSLPSNFPSLIFLFFPKLYENWFAVILHVKMSHCIKISDTDDI